MKKFVQVRRHIGIDFNSLPKDVIILEPQNIFNDGIVKFDSVLYYSLSKLIDSFLDKTELEYTEIIDYLYWNTWGYCPKGWPILIDDL